MKFTVIIPAFNEEAYLASTLDSLQSAAAYLRVRSNVEANIIVVDNNSDDGTAAVARDRGALVVVNADIIVPPQLLDEIRVTMNDLNCVGGAVDVDYQPRRLSMRLYLRAWHHLARLTYGYGSKRHAVLSTVRLRASRRLRRERLDRRGRRLLLGPPEVRQSKKSHGPALLFLRNTRVRPSSRRRFDNWPIWKTLILTNPLFIAVFRRWKRFWGGCYSRPAR